MAAPTRPGPRALPDAGDDAAADAGDHREVARRGLRPRGPSAAAERLSAAPATGTALRGAAVATVAVFGLLVAIAAVQTSRNADVEDAEPRRADRPRSPSAAAGGRRLQDADRRACAGGDTEAVDKHAADAERARRRSARCAARGSHRVRGPVRGPACGSRSTTTPTRERRRAGARQRPGPASTACGRPAPRRSRSTASGSPPSPRSVTPTSRSRSTARPLAPPYVVSAIGDTAHPARPAADTATRAVRSWRSSMAYDFGFDDLQRRTTRGRLRLPRRPRRLRDTPAAAHRGVRQPERPRGGHAVIAALGLLARRRARAVLRSPTCPLASSPTCRSRWSPRSTRSSAACAPTSTGSSTTRSSWSRSSATCVIAAGDRLPRRPARGRRPAVDRRHRRPRDPDLLQRRRDPQAPFHA